MSQKILIDGSNETQTQFALLSDNELEDFEFESISKKNLKGMHGYIPKDDSNFGFCMIIENKGERVSIEDPTSLKVVHSEINRCFEAQ